MGLNDILPDCQNPKVANQVLHTLETRLQQRAISLSLAIVKVRACPSPLETSIYDVSVEEEGNAAGRSSQQSIDQIARMHCKWAIILAI